jgi:serine/threonine-protein kinase
MSDGRTATEKLMEQLQAATLGDYEILAELGRGGMATVFLAHDLQLDRKVAIKVMHPALMEDGVKEGMVDRFKQEARTAAGLSHPNIIPIYAVRAQGHLLWIVMKFVPGRHWTRSSPKRRHCRSRWFARSWPA